MQISHYAYQNICTKISVFCVCVLLWQCMCMDERVSGFSVEQLAFLWCAHLFLCVICSGSFSPSTSIFRVFHFPFHIDEIMGQAVNYDIFLCAVWTWLSLFQHLVFSMEIFTMNQKRVLSSNGRVKKRSKQWIHFGLHYLSFGPIKTSGKYSDDNNYFWSKCTDDDNNRNQIVAIQRISHAHKLKWNSIIYQMNILIKKKSGHRWKWWRQRAEFIFKKIFFRK